MGRGEAQQWGLFGWHKLLRSTRKNMLRNSPNNLKYRLKSWKKKGYIFCRVLRQESKRICQEERRRNQSVWNWGVPAPHWNRSPASSAWGSKAKAAGQCSPTSEMGSAPAIPQEPAEGENPVSVTDYKGKGILDLMLVMMHLKFPAVQIPPGWF